MSFPGTRRIFRDCNWTRYMSAPIVWMLQGAVSSWTIWIRNPGQRPYGLTDELASVLLEYIRDQRASA